MTNVIVSGAIANKYLNGGNAWVMLSWIRGLQRLGCRVHFVEQIEPQNCVDSLGKPVGFVDCVNLAYLRQVTQACLPDAATLIYDNGRSTYGLTMDELADLADETDLLINISGHLAIEEIKNRIKTKIFVDLDPGYTQFWEASGIRGARLQGHDLFYTVGENIGMEGCRIPACGIDWRPIVPPVLLDEWPFVQGNWSANGFTTVASWRGAYGRVRWDCHLFGLKAHEFRKFIDLPRCTPYSFEIALDIHPADQWDHSALLRSGWKLANPKIVAQDPAKFRAYVQASDAEFSVAQGIYVETRSGWFSDRTTCYLASGKPVLVQDTGIRREYAAAGGIVLFRTVEEAIAGAEQIAADYGHHSRAARAVAEEFFDSDRVLGTLIERTELSISERG